MSASISLSLDDVDILDEALNEYIETMTPYMGDLKEEAEDLSNRVNALTQKFLEAAT